jgi:GT2 family glycosyltransferase
MLEPVVSVIVPTLNRPQLLISTLSDLVSQQYPSFEVLVIDQSDTINKDVVAFCAAHDNVCFIHIDHKSLPHARNIGIQRAQGQIVLFCDDDVQLPTRHFIAAHARNYTDPLVGGVAGRKLNMQEGDQNPLADIREIGRIRPWDMRIVTNFHGMTRCQVDHVNGCNMSFRKDALQKVGGFDTNFVGNAYFEDTDVSLQIRKLGYTLVFEPEALLIHLQAGTGGCSVQSEREFRYWYFHNLIYLFLKHFPRAYLPTFLLRQITYLLAITILRRDPGIVIAGLWGGLKGLAHFRRVQITSKQMLT